jgi:uncharacterized protein (TIGR02757 family)
MQIEKYRLFFEEIYQNYNHKKFLDTDPITYFYKSTGNKEFSAFIASLFAYGKVKLINRFLNDLFNSCMYLPNKIDDTELYYRFQKSEDIILLINFLSEIYEKYVNLENYFLEKSVNLEDAFVMFYEDVKNFGKRYNAGRGFYFLFPNPLKSGAKRFRMFFRWMIRNDNVDPGLWKNYKPKELIFPIDTHVIKFSYNNGIIKSKSNTYKNALKITEFFKCINQQDPVKYDFSLTRLGMLINCKYVKTQNCKNCVHIKKCPF